MAKRKNKEKFSIGFVEIPLDRLIQADWNYKDNDPDLAEALERNISERGQVENLIVRELGNDYEIVNGNHRLPVLKNLGYETAMCYNLGNINSVMAKRIAIETNETRFDNDEVILAKVIKDITEEIPMDELEYTMPYDRDELDEYLANASDFDWEEESQEGEPTDPAGNSGEDDDLQENEIECPHCGGIIIVEEEKE